MKQTMFKIALILAIGLLFSGAVSAATIKTTSVSISGVGQTAQIPVSLDSAPSGFAGYKMDVSLSKSGIAKIISVTLPEWAALKDINGTLPSEKVTLTTVDLLDNIKKDATDIPFATITVEGVSQGTTDLSFTVNEITDDDGNPIEFSINPAGIAVGVTNGSPVVSATPTPVVTQTPQAPVATPTPEVPSEPQSNPTIAPTPSIIPPEPKAPQVTPTPVPTVIAEFTTDVNNGSAPMTVSFTDLSEGYPDKFVWNFGDNSSDSTSVVQNPQHTYRIPGIYNVSLNASNSEYSNQTTKNGIVIISGMRQPQNGPKTNMQIFSVPLGAEVYMNNVYYGVTPVNVTNLSPNTYQLRLHKTGYYDVVSPVFANEGSLPTFISGFEMILHPAEIGKLVADPPQTGAAYIISYPELVDVTIDNKTVGKTDIMVMNLAVGKHNLTLMKEGFANWSDSLEIKNGLTTIQTYTFEKPYFPPVKNESYEE